MKAYPRLAYLDGDVNGGFDAIYEDEGLELRDYFAIRCLQSFMGNEEYRLKMLNDAKKALERDGKIISDITIAEKFSEYSYLYADAMMKAREL